MADPISIAPSADTLGARLVAFLLAEQAAGVKEDPPHSNTSIRIRDYFSVCRRRGSEGPIGITAGAWCAACVSYGLTQVSRPGEPYPSPRVSGLELQQDASENKSWFPASAFVAGLWCPKAGDICILRRPGESWDTHTCVVMAEPDELGRFMTIGGNEDDVIKTDHRFVADTDIIGFISLSS